VEGERGKREGIYVQPNMADFSGNIYIFETGGQDRGSVERFLLTGDTGY